ncbi:hypothetical protein DPM19_18115 [Actinomadura craniellae]|uniref:DUF2637 domain-containing protein n=1 Tax=Actinomadura craniellae TaxID=2231787 RepID=A0A365H3B3_9ACTN|nr:DUF2637 domain-containing protein [Actinomadura craniellae]RAY13594.1 hypothetical protein DPM19_18115 [Actinomadura craniellae]
MEDRRTLPSTEVSERPHSAVGDGLIRASTTVAVVGIGGIAAVVSFRHALAVVQAHGEDGVTGYLTPLTIDGLVFTASMVLLDAARRGDRPPALARVALALGVGATVAVNVLHGIERGPVGAVVAAWPAVTLVLVVELLMGMIRRGRVSATTADVDEVLVVAQLDHGAAAGVENELVMPVDERPAVRPVVESPGGEVLDRAAARLAALLDDEAVDEGDGSASPDLDPVIATACDRFAGVLATGGLPSVRALRQELRIGHPRAVRVRAALAGRERAPGVVATG